MNKSKKCYIKISICLIWVAMLVLLMIPQSMEKVYAFEGDMNCKSAILVEKNSGQILHEYNACERVPIASVTKLMTILLTLENIDNGVASVEDSVFVSENAQGMGGSQIFLEANANYELGQLLKSVIVCSANDSSVALAEHFAGSEKNFVKAMNERARELEMSNTNYSNCTGLPSTDGYSCAKDQAVLLCKVLNHDLYHTYSSIWMEDFLHPEGRTTMMTNTNKLSKFYSGCTGGKTGSTNQAKYCLAVGAKRDNVELVSVVLGAENSKERFRLSSELLDFGFANFESKVLFSDNDLQDKKIEIRGRNHSVKLKAERDYVFVGKKNAQINFSLNFNLPTQMRSVKENQVVGNVDIVVDGVVVDTINILSTETVKDATFFDYFKEITSI